MVRIVHTHIYETWWNVTNADEKPLYQIVYVMCERFSLSVLFLFISFARFLQIEYKHLNREPLRLTHLEM